MVRISQRDIEALTEGFSPTINNVTDEQTGDYATPRPGLKCEVLAPDGTLYDLANPKARDAATRKIGCVGPCAVRAASRTARTAPLY